MSVELIPTTPHGIARHASGFIVPAIIADAGEHAIVDP
jgi:hypothetical protein